MPKHELEQMDNVELLYYLSNLASEICRRANENREIADVGVSVLTNIFNDSREYMNTEQVAQYLGVCKTKTYQLLRLKGFPAMKQGGTWLVKKSDLDKWVREHRNSRAYIK